MKITSVLICFFFLLNACYQRSYEWEKIIVSNGISDEKFPKETTTSSINSSIYCIQLRLITKVPNFSYNNKRGRSMRPTNLIDSLEITSDVDFNPSFLAGDNLNSYFLLYSDNYFSLKPLNENISRELNPVINDKNGPFFKTHYLLLKEKPAVLGTRKFYVKAKYQNGTTQIDSVEINLN